MTPAVFHALSEPIFPAALEAKIPGLVNILVIPSPCYNKQIGVCNGKVFSNTLFWFASIGLGKVRSQEPGVILDNRFKISDLRAQSFAERITKICNLQSAI